MDSTLSSDRRSTSSLLAIAVGAATSAFVVALALGGHQFGVVDIALVLVASAVILGLNLRQVPQRPLLRHLPAAWEGEVVVRAPRAADLSGRQTSTGHAA